jgi:hypothetical protein
VTEGEGQASATLHVLLSLAHLLPLLFPPSSSRQLVQQQQQQHRPVRDGRWSRSDLRGAVRSERRDSGRSRSCRRDRERWSRPRAAERLDGWTERGRGTSSLYQRYCEVRCSLGTDKGRGMRSFENPSLKDKRRSSTPCAAADSYRRRCTVSLPLPVVVLTSAQSQRSSFDFSLASFFPFIFRPSVAAAFSLSAGRLTNAFSFNNLLPLSLAFRLPFLLSHSTTFRLPF